MLMGTLEADDKGLVVVTAATLFAAPMLVETVWRVTAVDGRDRLSVGARVEWKNGAWNGYGFRVATESEPETVKQSAVRKPSGRHVWRDGEWRKR